jgi:hypothetical protein
MFNANGVNVCKPKKLPAVKKAKKIIKKSKKK